MTAKCHWSGLSIGTSRVCPWEVVGFVRQLVGFVRLLVGFVRKVVGFVRQLVGFVPQISKY